MRTAWRLAYQTGEPMGMTPKAVHDLTYAIMRAVGALESADATTYLLTDEEIALVEANAEVRKLIDAWR